MRGLPVPLRYLHFLFRLPRRQKRLVQLLADVLLITFSFLMAMLLRLDSWDFVSNPHVWGVLPVMVPVSLVIFIRLGFYRAVIRYMNQKAVQVVVAGVAGSAGVLMVVNYLFSLPVPRSVPFIYAMLAMLTIGGVRFALRAIYLRGQIRHKTRVLVYGAGEAGRQLVGSLRQGQEHEPIAFIDDAPALQGAYIQGAKVYPAEEIPRLIEDYGVDKLLLAIPSASRGRRREILATLEPLHVPVQSIPGMADVVSGRARVNEIRDVAVEDLLGRDPVPPDPALMGANITGKVVMVTGAGGSIGSELCRQILRLAPRELLLLEVSEFNLYRIEQDLLRLSASEGLVVTLRPLLGSVQHRSRLEAVMSRFGVQTVYHAAAYKHVPLVEHNMVEGLRNNVLGTQCCAEAAIVSGVESFVLVSTDKAVRPTNVMGASKRLAELVCQALGAEQQATVFSMVRFGNVLGSSGSVVPLFRRQIKAGGPITVTHPEITRYFMTIPEAAQLVIQAGAMARGGDVFVLDMGEPVKIIELARHMVRLSGLEPGFPRAAAPEGGSIGRGRRAAAPGRYRYRLHRPAPRRELYEELLIGDDPEPTRHRRIMTANEVSLTWSELRGLLERLVRALRALRLSRPAPAAAGRAYRLSAERRDRRSDVGVATASGGERSAEATDELKPPPAAFYSQVRSRHPARETCAGCLAFWPPVSMRKMGRCRESRVEYWVATGVTAGSLARGGDDEARETRATGDAERSGGISRREGCFWAPVVPEPPGPGPLGSAMVGALWDAIPPARGQSGRVIHAVDHGLGTSQGREDDTAGLQRLIDEQLRDGDTLVLGPRHRLGPRLGIRRGFQARSTSTSAGSRVSPWMPATASSSRRGSRALPRASSPSRSAGT